MKRFFSVLLAVGLVATLAGRAGAVDFQEDLKKLAQDTAIGYTTPLATAFGTCMNSGLYHTAKPHKLLGFDISIKPSAALVPDEDKFYDFIVPGMFDVPMNMIQPGSTDTLHLNGANIWTGSKQASTVFGPDSTHAILPAGADAELEAAMRRAGRSDAEIAIARQTPEWQNAVNSIPAINTVPGLNLDGLPLVLPQVSVGLIFGTEVLVRYLPEVDAGDVGKVKFWGFGVKHSISQWIPLPLLGIDITGQYVKQQLKVGTVLESNHTAMNLEVSRRFGFMLLSLTPYAGFGVESSDLKVDYVVENPNNDVSLPPDGSHIGFKLDGDNTSRMTVGGRLQLAFLTINADYSMGAYNAYSAGVGITLR